MSVFGKVSNIYNNASSGTLPQTSKSSSELKNEFLSLLLTQLKNQDPTKPVDSSQMIAQQAQFASLEQMQNMNTNLLALMSMQNVTQAVSLIGKHVTGKLEDGTPLSGAVTAINFDGGNPQVKVGGKFMSLAMIETIGL